MGKVVNSRGKVKGIEYIEGDSRPYLRINLEMPLSIKEGNGYGRFQWMNKCSRAKFQIQDDSLLEQARREIATGDYIEVDVHVSINEGNLSEILKNFTILQSTKLPLGESRKLEVWHSTSSIPRQDIDELDLSSMSSEQILDTAGVKKLGK